MEALYPRKAQIYSIKGEDAVRMAIVLCISYGVTTLMDVRAYVTLYEVLVEAAEVCGASNTPTQ